MPVMAALGTGGPDSHGGSNRVWRSGDLPHVSLLGRPSVGHGGQDSIPPRGSGREHVFSRPPTSRNSWVVVASLGCLDVWRHPSASFINTPEAHEPSGPTAGSGASSGNPAGGAADWCPEIPGTTAPAGSYDR